MSSTRSRTEAALLEARDGRERELRRALAHPEAGGAGAILMAGTNVPGPRKHPSGLAPVFHGALEALGRELPMRVALSGFDALGPFHLAYLEAPGDDAKRATVALESAEPSGRLLDLDVYRPDGTPVDRAGLGLPQRPCLVCQEPARDCIRVQRHSLAELEARTASLIHGFTRAPRRLAPDLLAAALHQGALRELDVTPKPGLVDRLDNGSHPDLSFEAMRASADLLPLYYEDLLQLAGRQASLAEVVQAGRDAEARMVQEIRSNGHRGFIFLSGLVLLAACQCGGRLVGLRGAIAEVAERFFAHQPAPDTPGARVRALHGLGGIQAEAMRGLPSVFEHGWPAYRRALESGCGPREAAFQLMATLMRTVEDTTAVRRRGLEGLERLRRDGEALHLLLARGGEPVPFLTALNGAYRRDNLTMGGVADCMALTFALQEAAR